MSLKPQDLMVALKLASPGGQALSYGELAQALSMSVSEVHAAVKRGRHAGLLGAGEDGGDRRPRIAALLEFIRHGVPYAFAPQRGVMTRGMPTGAGAPVLADVFGESAQVPSVWPDPQGDTRGEAFEPLYRSVPAAARNDPGLYALLALVDAIRGGRARERGIASTRLEARLRHEG